ncbi:MAG: GLPGLI family protein [Polaribacter sp.]|jgi:GLPGLI family protein
MKTIIAAVALLFVFTINAQNFTGKAIYRTSTKSTLKFGKDQDGVTDKMQEELKKQLQKMNQKTFILEFDRKTSTYKEEVSLASPKSKIGGAGVFVSSLGGSGNKSIYYKDIIEKRFVNQTEIQGKRFLVKDKLLEINWELSSETKNIGTYTCYKATYSKEVDKVEISIKDGETVEDKSKETMVTTAWYTPQIPVSNGPGNYQGLPGLILEVNDGKKTIVCAEIILNSSKKITVIAPKKGKVVSQKKYIKIQKQKRDEMMEKFQGRNGFDMGNGINIKIGG